MMELEPGTLQKLALFSELAPAELSLVQKALHRQSFAAGKPVLSAEQWGDVMYIVQQGTVKVHIEQADGKDVILAILGAGDLVGELSMLDRQGRAASVVTLEQSTLLWINRPEFEEFLMTMPHLTLALARILAGKLRLSNVQIQSLATQDVFGRVAQLLLAFAERYGKPGGNGERLIQLHLTQTELASMVGASRVRVNHVLSSYKERGYISVDHDNYIMIHDHEALAKRAQ